MSAPLPAASSRRQQLLAIAGELFAERGYKFTTVRDIADAAGILSGSLYHHFDSKESIVDELMSAFQADLFASYDQIAASDATPREKIEAVVRRSFDAIDQHPNEVAIYQRDAAYLGGFSRFGYLVEYGERYRALWTGLLREGVAAGELRPDIDVELVYRFVRDTVWVAVSWYRPGGKLSARDIADSYLEIVLHGIAEGTPS